MSSVETNTTVATSTAAAVASVGTSYDAAKVLAVQMKLNGQQRAYLVGIDLDLAAISSATKVTMRLSSDAAGDSPIVPDTEATIAAGITTATVGLASMETDREYDFTGLTNEVGYVHFKTDAGTVTVNSATVYHRSKT